MSLLDCTCLVRALKAGLIARSAAPAGPSPLLTDLRAYYFGAELAGDLLDDHDDGLDFTDHATVTSGAGVGPGQTARQFAAASVEHFTHASTPALAGSAAAWSRWGWVRIDDNAAIRFIMDCNNGVTGWSIYVQGNVLRSLVGTGAANVILPHGAVPDATWVFFYVEFNGTQLRASVNGGAFGSAPAAAHAPSGAEVSIGAALGGALPMQGRLQGIGFSDRVLTQDEIDWLVNAGAAARSYAEILAYTG